MGSVGAGHLIGRDQLPEDCRQPTSEQLRAEVVELPPSPYASEENSSLPNGTVSRVSRINAALSAPVLCTAESDIDEDVTEDLGEVGGPAVKRVVVEQQHRHLELLGRPQEGGEP